MRILIVAKENRSIQQLEKALRNLDADIEEIGYDSHLALNIEQVIRESAPDWIVINKQGVIQNNDILNGGIDKSTGPVELSGKYLFKTLRLEKKIEKSDFQVFPGLGTELVNGNAAGGRAVDKAKEITKSPALRYRQRFLVKQGQRFHSIDIKDIAYFFSEDRFIFMKTKDNVKFLFEYRIEELEQMLDPNLFFRVNRAFYIAISSIEQVSVYPGNRLKLTLKPASEKEIIVSRERVTAFRVWLGE